MRINPTVHSGMNWEEKHESKNKDMNVQSLRWHGYTLLPDVIVLIILCSAANWHWGCMLIKDKIRLNYEYLTYLQ